MNVLSVAEKPSVAKELANIIGRGSAVRRNGHSQYNHSKYNIRLYVVVCGVFYIIQVTRTILHLCRTVFEIAQCEFMGRNVSMSITSVTGHMMGMDFDARYKSWQGVNPEQLFTAEVGFDFVV